MATSVTQYARQRKSRNSQPNHVHTKASKPLESLRLAFYARVSSDEQEKKNTIAAQFMLLRKWAEALGYLVVAEYKDDPCSGLMPLKDRLGGKQLLQDAQAGLFDIVVCAKIDRLSRSLWELLAAHRALEACGVSVKSATEPIDTSDPIGRFLFSLLGGMAELDRERILEQLSRGRDRVTRNGDWTNGPIPLGYTVKRKQDRKLRESTRILEKTGLSEADFMRDLFQRIANGSSGIAEARRLQALGVPLVMYYANGNRHVSANQKWHMQRITFFIRNTIYKGEHTFKSRFGPITRQVPALVSEELWEAANTQLRKNQALPKSNARQVYILQGVIKCGLCGKSYTGQHASGKRYPDGHYYRCNGGSGSKNPLKAHRCKNKAINMKLIEQRVWERCKGFILNPGDILADIANQVDTKEEDTTQREHEVTVALAHKSQEEERLLTVFRRGSITLSAFEAAMQEVEKDRQILHNELATYQAQKKIRYAKIDYLRRSKDLLMAWRTKLPAIEAANDRQAMHTLVEDFVASIMVFPDRTEIVYRFDGEETEAAVGGENGVAVENNSRNTGRCYSLLEVWNIKDLRQGKTAAA